MLNELRKCPACATYTLRAACPACATETKTAHPARFSPHDKWAAYRRREKFGDLAVQTNSGKS